MIERAIPGPDRLVAPLPSALADRVLLFAMRRMAAAGLDDAHAANAMLGRFGLGYRRPLVLLRALMAELARASTRSITVAPCCCLKVTGDEQTLLRAIAAQDSRAAYALLTALLGTPDCLGAVTTAEAVGQALRDLGCTLERDSQD